MSELDDLRNITLQVNLTGKLPAPWNELWKIKNETDLLKVGMVHVHKQNPEAFYKESGFCVPVEKFDKLVYD